MHGVIGCYGFCCCSTAFLFFSFILCSLVHEGAWSWRDAVCLAMTAHMIRDPCALCKHGFVHSELCVHHGCLPPAPSTTLMIHMIMSIILSYWLTSEQRRFFVLHFDLPAFLTLGAAILPPLFVQFCRPCGSVWGRTAAQQLIQHARVKHQLEKQRSQWNDF